MDMPLEGLEGGSDGLAAVAGAGDRVATLRALRDRLARDIDGCESLRDLASLSQRLMDVLAQIAEAERAEPERKGTALDELARWRSSGAARPVGAAKRL